MKYYVTMVVKEVSKWGDSMVVPLTHEFKSLGIRVGDTVNVEIDYDKRQIIIRKA